jgi:hypothetical protein
VPQDFDPTPWWRRARVIRTTSLVFWCLASAAAAVTGWFADLVFANSVWLRVGGAEILLGTEGIPAWASGGFDVAMQVTVWTGIVAAALAFSLLFIDSGGRGWLLIGGIGALVLSLGGGALIGGAVHGRVSLLPILLVLAGLVLLLLRTGLRLLGRRRAAVRAEAAPHTVLATGRVHSTGVVTISDELHWTVVVAFTDAAGRPHGARGTFRAPGTPQPHPGDEVTVSYDPRHPRRRVTTDVRLRPARPGRR